MKNTIKIWRFEDAPKKFQNLSTNGGDENYIAFIPDSYLKDNYDSIPSFFEEGTSFGICCVEKIKIKNGTILIGSHS